MPVDGEQLIRRLAVLLIYQCMSVPVWGTYVLHQHHSFMYITDMSAFYVLTGQVTYRMTYNQSPHIRVRSGIYHFVRRVPADLQQHYRSDRVSISLRTKSARAASRSAVSINQRLDDYWHGL